MKKLIGSTRGKLVVFVLAMLSAVGAFAQDDPSIPKSKLHLELYSGFFPYLVFGVVVLFLGYVSYRYWKDNQPDDMGHQPHHQ